MRKDQLPYAPAPYESRHVSAVQLLTEGECPAHLQQEFIRWLIEDVSRTYDMSFRFDPYQTAFAEGRRFVGNQVVNMMHLDAKKVRSENE